MKNIPLTQGEVALVDDENFEKVCTYKWYLHNSGYGARRGRKGERSVVFLHHQISGIPEDGLQTDHINRDRLDNRKSNLRVATRSQNCANRAKPNIETSSEYKGVYFDYQSGRWRSVIEIEGKKKSIGRFSKEQDAALAYNKAAINLFGTYAKLNKI